MAADSADRPVLVAETDRLFRRLAVAGGVGLAVSGGADSLALMKLFAQWRERSCPEMPVRVFTVDHGLRPESAAEAAMVADRAAALGLVHETLNWSGDKPRTGLQAAARRARYHLLCARCQALGLSHLVTAHHLDDQAETVLMRLTKGSGIDGLAAMAPEAVFSGTVLSRPLLDVPRSRLVATLQAAGETWIEDPTNADDRFMRPRLRRLLPQLAGEGMTRERLAELARRAARARAALEAATDELHARSVAVDPAGFCRIDAAAFARAPEEIGLRLLGRVVAAVSGGAQVRLARLEKLHEMLTRRGEGAGGATLGGCRIVPRDGVIAIIREAGRQRPASLAAERPGAVIWDGRFRVRLARGVEGGVIRPLGREGVAALKESSALRRIPAAAARVSPGLFVGARLYAAPQVEARPGPFSPPGVRIEFVGPACPVAGER